MAGIYVKSLRSPDETRPFGKGKMQLVRLGDEACGLGTFEAGWRWSTNVGPLAGTPTCEGHHFGYCLSGRMRIRMNDGEEQDIKSGDSFTIEPGHDAWVVGDETCLMLDFGGYTHYAEKRAGSTKYAGEQPRPSVH